MGNVLDSLHIRRPNIRVSAGGKEAVATEKELVRANTAAAAEQITAGETAEQQQRGRTTLAQVRTRFGNLY